LYNGALRASVLYLKIQPYICGRIRKLIKQTYRLSESALSADLVIPVPLHPKRHKERGYNQAEIVAREIASASRLSVDFWSFKRLKATDRHRAGLDRYDRSRDMKKAFSVNRPAAVVGKTILLVDDVFTTGATLNECAVTLKAAGAIDVKVFSLARVI
jgi:ComF family protein